MTSRPTYHATATPDGKFLAVEIHDLPPDMVGVTQGRTVDEAEAMARDAIALLLEVPEDSFDLVLTVKD
jgi:predicted RNase H-like HicB family nuclease